MHEIPTRRQKTTDFFETQLDILTTACYLSFFLRITFRFFIFAFHSILSFFHYTRASRY